MTRLPWILCCALLAVAVAAVEAETEAQSSYIVHVAHSHAPRPSRRRLLARAYYASFVRDTLPESIARPAPRVFYSYAHAATGFAARLTELQAAHLESQPSVLAVLPDETLQLHTTLTPSFLRLSSSSGLLKASRGAADVVIGVIDSGIYPDGRTSFAADPTLPPPPTRFRGGCVSAPSFNASAYCNNKLVGAKFFHHGIIEAAYGSQLDATDDSTRSPLDDNGHGTHAASTAAGAPVPGAAFYNYGKGDAVGMAPGARIASYKACSRKGCTSADILAAFDEAVADGVDVISISLGAVGKAPKFYKDTLAMAALRAVRKGIVVSASAGNFGPGEFTAVNIAPWILTVAASSIDRWYPASVVLGSGKTFTGTSLYAGAPLGPEKLPLVYGGDVGSNVCESGKLNAGLVAGKIVLCDPGVNGRAAKGAAVKLAGGAGAIITGTEDFGEQAVTTPHVLPATAVTFAAAEKIKKYMAKEANPVATIVFHGTVVDKSKMPSFPRMASFSSRGPNLRAQEILKPDLTAPGVDILAAWTGDNSPTQLDGDARRVEFNIISGTSMACPHVSGIAALLREVRPDWSPAAIKSALMTTAYNVDNKGDVIKDMSTGKESTPFVRGAGHVDPNRAADPGLVYDASADGYISFLCALGYTPEQIALFTTKEDPPVDCSTRTTSVGDLNYPAFSVVFNSPSGEVKQHRVVRNVGSNVRATYTASVTSPAGVSVTVKPQKLQFSATQKKQEYEIIFAAHGVGSVAEKYTFGSIVWSDGEHNVTSPIAITWPGSQVAAM
ncbi:hypothetical protein QOZ80_2AG0148000 [Eleusine coracana subsp. coracana]|nr:hypothetical protein QOZ80_2AG0148000 [Eleusine coracana subsp. coracana]